MRHHFGLFEALFAWVMVAFVMTCAAVALALAALGAGALWSWLT